jgi:sugar-specific transcriptional regulator TrmB
MGKILKAFLTNQLRVDSGTEGRSPEQKRLCDRESELQDKLAEKLNDEEKEILTELVDTIFEESCYDEQNKFERGSRLGVLITAEVFAEQNIFL